MRNKDSSNLTPLDAVAAAKATKVPLGGGPPLDKGKMQRLGQSIKRIKDAVAPVPQFAMPSQNTKEKEPVLDRPLNPEVQDFLSNPGPLSDQPTPTGVGPLHEGDFGSVSDKAVAQQMQAESEVTDQQVFEVPQNVAPHLQTPIWGSLTDARRRKAIEARLKPLSFDDLVLRGSVSQDIFIRSNYVLRLGTLKQYEKMFVLESLYGLQGSDAYVEATQSLYCATCALEQINGKSIPTHREYEGDMLKERVSPELFEKKLGIVKRLAAPIFLDILIQFDWLNERAHELLTTDNMKNF